MLTNPNTLGLFDPNIEEIARDRPRGRRDALLRRRQPQRRNGDLPPRRHGLRHRPLQPPQVLHPAPRRRRPRLRADRGLRAHRAVPARARGRPEREDGTFDARSRRGARAGEIDVRADPAHRSPSGSKSIGRLRGFQGNYGCFVRAYAYICSLGADGLRDVSETAVLNANYLLARLREHGVAEYLPLAYGELCMHEFVLSGGPMKRELQIKTLDLAKRLLDFGFHPPTVYFPLLVDEALMVEPTETETKRDARRLRRRDRRDPARGRRGSGGCARARPTRTPVRRLDEVARGEAAGDPPGAPRRVLGQPMRIFSGIQPTGRKHLGNYVGAIVQYVAGQERGEALYCIVDLHATTVGLRSRASCASAVRHSPRCCSLPASTRERCILFRQSDVHEHTELCWLLVRVTELGRLQRMHQFRDKSLGAARARIRRAALLPGAAGRRRARLPRARGPGRRGPARAPRADARRRAALQRALRRRREVLVVPEHRIPEVGARIMDLQDPTRKMSTTAGPASRARVYVLDEPAAIEKKLRRAVTDSGSEIRRDPEKPGVSQPDRDPRRGARAGTPGDGRGRSRATRAATAI